MSDTGKGPVEIRRSGRVSGGRRVPQPRLFAFAKWIRIMRRFREENAHGRLKPA